MSDGSGKTGSCVAFDIGNVCIAISPERCEEATGIPNDLPEWAGLCYDFECGRLGEELFLERAKSLVPKGHRLDGGIRSAFEAKILQPIPGMEALLKGLAELGMRPVFFSDISTIHLECFRSRFSGAEDYGGVYSFEVGSWKPSEAMFTAFEERYGVPLLYLDDRQDLIEAARRRGWRSSVQFSSAAETDRFLREAISAGGKII